MMLTAVYLRVSTEHQAEEGYSLPSQKTACLKKAKELGGEVPNDLIFTEDWPGPELDRPQLNELRELVRQRQIECLVVYSTDRLSRNPIHLAILAEECEKNHVLLDFVTEPMDNSPEGALIRYVRGYAGQIEREKIRERTIRGKKEKARAGKLSMGGPCPYGYQIIDKKRAIDPIKAETVRIIYNWFAYDDMTICRAATKLNKMGVSGPIGNRWTETAVFRILNQPSYKGETYAFRYKHIEPKYHKKKVRYSNNKVVLRDKSEWILMPGATPPIVTPETWQLAQDNLRRNRRKAPRNRKHEYLLTNGRLRCGTCGMSMPGSVKYKDGKPYYFYRCIKNSKVSYYPGGCEQHSISTYKIDVPVWNEILAMIKNPKVILRELNSRRNKELPAMLEAEIVANKAKMVKVVKERERYIQAFGQELIEQDELTRELDRLKQGQNEIEARMADLELRLKNTNNAAKNYESLTTALTELADKVDNPSYQDKQLAVEMLDIQVTLRSDGKMILSGIIPSSAINYGTSYNCEKQSNPLAFDLLVPVSENIVINRPRDNRGRYI